MSDALTDISKETKAKMEWSVAIHFFADRIYKQLRHVKDREDWESDVTDYLEMILDEIAEELELMAVGDF